MYLRAYVLNYPDKWDSSLYVVFYSVLYYSSDVIDLPKSSIAIVFIDPQS
jgi:hypothetical protein